ncbi:MAG: hypothetical protein R3C24_07760 [Cyanobacteriota/Melainabacteria group bacterium]
MLKFMTEAEARQSLMVLRAQDELIAQSENFKGSSLRIFLWCCKELPNRYTGQRVVIDEGVNPNDIWTRQSYDPDFIIGCHRLPGWRDLSISRP